MVVGRVGRVGRGALSLIMNLIVDWYDDRTVTFASGLRPDWKSGGNTIKDHPKKSSNVQVSAGGLEDSDAEDVKPFPSTKSRARNLSEEEVAKGAQNAKRDLSRRNDVSILAWLACDMTPNFWFGRNKARIYRYWWGGRICPTPHREKGCSKDPASQIGEKQQRLHVSYDSCHREGKEQG